MMFLSLAVPDGLLVEFVRFYIFEGENVRAPATNLTLRPTLAKRR